MADVEVTYPFPPSTGRPVVIYGPHADDETIFFAQMIVHHVLAGREVHVVLCCNGNLSNVFEELNGVVSDSTWWGGYHSPEHEGYTPLTRDGFARARALEMVNACLQMGVQPQNIHFGTADGGITDPARLPDAISRDWADMVIGSWAQYFESFGYPSVGHYTMHWKDIHADHTALGQSLHGYRVSGDPRWADARWMVKPEQAVAVGASEYSVPTNLQPLVKFRQHKAALCYGAWAPPYSFAIGWHSVYTPYFDDVLNGAVNWVVRNP